MVIFQFAKCKRLPEGTYEMAMFWAFSDTPTLLPSPIFSTARHHRIDHFPAATAHGIFAGVVNWSPDPTKAEATARQNLRSMDQNMRNHWESKHLDKHMWQCVKTMYPW